MENIYIQIIFSNITSEQTELLIAKLNEINFTGFEEDANTLKAFIPSKQFDESALHRAIRGLDISFSKSIISETNWNKVWESSFQPVIIDDFVGIRAGFHEPIKEVKHEIIITPKMSFGTGHHPTTAMMIQQMKEIDFIDKNVLDFGTGSGILSILAGKLGAKEIMAIDNDAWSIENAKENFQQNNCDKIELIKSDIITGGIYDIILANITKNVILENFYSITKSLSKNGILLISGLLYTDEEEILDEAGKFSLNKTKLTEQSGWICIRFAY